jgi:hypothetical protein
MSTTATTAASDSIRMRLATVAKRIPMWYDNHVSFYIQGAPGMGKTSVIEAAAEQMVGRVNRRTGKPFNNFGIITVNGPSLTIPDVIGYGVPNRFKDSNKIERTEMVFSEPFFARDRHGNRWDQFEGGFFFVDEFDKCDLDVKKLLSETFLSGRIGPHWLPEGWMICAAGNRSKDRSGSTKFFDHQINRTRWIDVDLPFGDWENWATDHGLLPVVIAFAKQNWHIIEAGVPEKQGPFCTARSLAKVDSYFQYLIGVEGYLPDDPVVVAETAADIGHAACHQLFAFMRIGAKAPTIEQIVANPRDRSLVPTDPSLQMITCYNCARETTEENLDAVTTFISMLDGEFSATYYRAVIKTHKYVVRSPQFMEWAAKNSKLMALLTANV